MQFNLFSLLLYVWFCKMVLQIILVNNIMWAKSNIHEKPSLFVLPLPYNFNAFTIHVNRLHYTHLSEQKVAWDLDVCSISQGVSNFFKCPKNDTSDNLISTWYCQITYLSSFKHEIKLSYGDFRNIGDGIDEYEMKIRSTKHV